MLQSRSTSPPAAHSFFQDAVQSRDLLGAQQLVIKVPPPRGLISHCCSPLRPPRPESSRHENARVQQQPLVGMCDVIRPGKSRSACPAWSNSDSVNLLTAAAAVFKANKWSTRAKQTSSLLPPLKRKPTLPMQTRL